MVTSASVKDTSRDLLPPTREQLSILAMRSAIPMVGFGIMDNVVMITAGGAIDSTIGVSLGISTMAAAGLGQCCSDVAGVTSGGIVDSLVGKLNLKHHGLSPEQLDLRAARLWSTLGACVGVVSGCLIGMTVLWFMDTDKAERAKRAKELKSIFESVVDEGHKLVEAERATLFLIDSDKEELWSQVATGIRDEIIRVPLCKGWVGYSVSNHRICNVPDVYDGDEQQHFDPSIDKSTGYKTVSLLVVPILSKTEPGKVIGAVEMINKVSGDGTIVPFTETDEKIVSVLASHVASFIQVVDAD